MGEKYEEECFGSSLGACLRVCFLCFFVDGIWGIAGTSKGSNRGFFGCIFVPILGNSAASAGVVETWMLFEEKRFFFA